MIPAPLPSNETERHAALRQCAVLDTAPEPAFDDIAKLASQLCATPIALVSLVDASRQWFKAKVGLAASETPRDSSFCAHAVFAEQPLIVHDATLDPRFSDNPLVTGDPFVRFYAGIPLCLEPGIAVGSLCVIDHVPRELDESQLNALKMLAKQVISELMLRRALEQTRLDQAGARGSAAQLSETVSDAAQLRGTGRPRAGLPLALGELVANRYRVQRVLGVGGMGIVAAALDTAYDRQVAIKFMLLEVHDNREALQRFVREAQALEAIASEHVARLYDVGNLPNHVPYIVMELLNGEDLEARLRRDGRLSLPAALEIMMEACLGIEAAHALGILHRDLKPANLFLHRTEDGRQQVKLLDFGISKHWHAEEDVTQTALTNARTTLGSPHYMSPEQMTSPDQVDRRADIWSLGVILYQMVAGTLPFEGGSFPALCAAILTGRPLPLSEHLADVPAQLVSVVGRCLEKQPQYRYSDVAQLRAALRTIQP